MIMMRRREFTKGLAAITLYAAAIPSAATGAPAPTPKFDFDIIIPDLRFDHEPRQTIHDNTITIHYAHMARWRKLHGSDVVRMECAEVGSERYAQWLAEQTDPKPYPPHIQFGGPVVGTGDPQILARWEAYAASTLR
jgi:hypothetical protein